MRYVIIPWDDDIDIAMTREDYDHFKKIVREENGDKYYITDPQDNTKWGNIIPKLRLRRTIYKIIFDYGIESPGIFMDILVIENTFNNPILRVIHGVGCYFWGFLYSCRSSYYGNRKMIRKLNGLNLMQFINREIKIAVGFCLSFLPVQTVGKQTVRWYAMCKDNQSKYISIPSDGPHFFGGLTLRENLCETVEFEFEGRTMNLPREYDSYLRGIYGNYMEVPPEDKRVRDFCLEFDPGPYRFETQRNENQMKKEEHKC